MQISPGKRLVARYAKEDFDDDDLEKKRTVVVKLGEKLEILDRTIQFTPNKYFIPLEEMIVREKLARDMVRTENKDSQKSKNTPVGVLALPNESTSIPDLNSSWLTLMDEIRNSTFTDDIDKYSLKVAISDQTSIFPDTRKV